MGKKGTKFLTETEYNEIKLLTNMKTFKNRSLLAEISKRSQVTISRIARSESFADYRRGLNDSKKVSQPSVDIKPIVEPKGIKVGIGEIPSNQNHTKEIVDVLKEILSTLTDISNNQRRLAVAWETKKPREKGFLKGRA